MNIADLAAFETWPAYVPHGISKSGVVQLTRSLARVLAPEVRVDAVAPGAVLLPEKWNDEDAERLRRTTPLARLGSAEDVAQTVLFILDSEYLTGETIIVRRWPTCPLLTRAPHGASVQRFGRSSSSVAGATAATTFGSSGGRSARAPPSGTS